VTLFAATLASAVLSACSGTSGVADLAPDVQYKAPPDGGSTSDATDGAAALSTSMRVAHLAPFLGAVDICVQAPGSETFLGPLISPGASADAGGTLDASSAADARAADGSFLDGPSSSLDSDIEDSVPPDTEPATDAGSREGGPTEAGAPKDGAASDGGSTEGGEAGVGTASGLLPETLSRYIDLRGGGTFEFAIVAAGLGSCGTPYLTQQVTLDPGKSTTVVLTRTPGLSADAGIEAGGVGEAGEAGARGVPGAGALTLLSFVDESDARSGAARTRFINVARSPSSGEGVVVREVDVLDQADKAWRLAALIDPDAVSSPSSSPPFVDALGYHESVAIDPPEATISSRKALRVATGDAGGEVSSTSDWQSLDLSSASVHTGFLAASGGLAVLWCDDRAAGPLGACLWIDLFP
jgi:hypothetical protein